MNVVRLKSFCCDESARLGLSRVRILEYLQRGEYAGVRMRRAGRATFVSWRGALPLPRCLPAAGEMPMKQWVIEEAERLGVTRTAIYMRISAGGYPELGCRRVNTRLVFVRPAAMENRR